MGLCSTAIEHLVERPNGKTLKDVPGFTDAFANDDKPILDLLAVFAEKNYHLKEELYRMKKDTIPTFKVTLLRQGEWKEEFFVKKTALVSTILKKVEDNRGVGPHQGHWALRIGYSSCYPIICKN